MDPDGTTRTSYSTYLTVWRRADVEEWRYVIDGGNDRLHPEGVQVIEVEV